MPMFWSVSINYFQVSLSDDFTNLWQTCIHFIQKDVFIYNTESVAMVLNVSLIFS